MKKIEWEHPNKMVFESEHKTFNRQTRCISTGNVFGSTQLSFYIRPTNEVVYNGKTFPKGHLRDYDLEFFKLNQYNNIRKNVIKYSDKGIKTILYKFRHFMNGKEVVDGFVLTDTNHCLLQSYVVNRTRKGYSIIEEAIKYITNE